MTRRRLTLAACVLLSIGAGWLVWFERPVAEEQNLVGRWRHEKPNGGEDLVIELQSDHRLKLIQPSSVAPLFRSCHWAVRDGMMAWDFEPNPVLRFARPIARKLGFKVAERDVWHIHVSADSFTLGPGEPHPTVYTRDPGD
jgi:hypothetical protein